jgi:hypothetical protein
MVWRLADSYVTSVCVCNGGVPLTATAWSVVAGRCTICSRAQDRVLMCRENSARRWVRRNLGWEPDAIWTTQSEMRNSLVRGDTRPELHMLPYLQLYALSAGVCHCNSHSPSLATCFGNYLPSRIVVFTEWQILIHSLHIYSSLKLSLAQIFGEGLWCVCIVVEG